MRSKSQYINWQAFKHRNERTRSKETSKRWRALMEVLAKTLLAGLALGTSIGSVLVGVTLFSGLFFAMCANIMAAMLSLTFLIIEATNASGNRIKVLSDILILCAFLIAGLYLFIDALPTTFSLLGVFTMANVIAAITTTCWLVIDWLSPALETGIRSLFNKPNNFKSKTLSDKEFAQIITFETNCDYAELSNEIHEKLEEKRKKIDKTFLYVWKNIITKYCQKPKAFPCLGHILNAEKISEFDQAYKRAMKGDLKELRLTLSNKRASKAAKITHIRGVIDAVYSNENLPKKYKKYFKTPITKDNKTSVLKDLNAGIEELKGREKSIPTLPSQEEIQKTVKNQLENAEPSNAIS